MSAAELLAQALCAAEESNAADNERDHYAFQAGAGLDALKAARYAVVVVPPMVGDDGINRAWPHASYWHGQGCITLHSRGDLTAEQARAIAGSLIAAADAAEAQS